MHSDVGGGYLENESGLAKIPLEWMLVESRSAGLRLDDTVVRATLKNKPSKDLYKRHQSLDWKWFIAEFIPKVTFRQVALLSALFNKRRIKWIRFNIFRKRYLSSPDKVTLYRDTVNRINHSDDSYKPSNLSYENKPADERKLDHRYQIENRAEYFTNELS